MYGPDRLIQDLLDLGYEVEKVAIANDNFFGVIKSYEVPVGRFQGRIIDLGIQATADFPRTVGGINNFGVQRYRYLPGNMELDIERNCNEDCDCLELEGKGDIFFSLYGKDVTAEAARKRQSERPQLQEHHI